MKNEESQSNMRRDDFYFFISLALDERRGARLTWWNMNEEAVNCPSCGGEIDPVQKRCAHCGCWLGVRGISFYAFWVGLSLVVTALLAFMFYIGFQMLNRML